MSGYLIRTAALLRTLGVQRGDVVAHTDPDIALRMGVWMVLSAVESRIVHAWGGLGKTSDETMAVEITRMVVAYLGIESKYGVYAPPPPISDTKHTGRRKKSSAAS